MWVTMPDLPLSLCRKDALEFIGNKIGKFIRLEDGWDSNIDRHRARILVEVNLMEGLLEEIEMVLLGLTWI